MSDKKKKTQKRWSAKMADEVFELLALGFSLKAIGQMPQFITHDKIKLHIAKDEKLQQRYLDAKRVGALWMADELMEIADSAAKNSEYYDQEGNKRVDTGGVQAHKLMVESRKWALVKLLPRVFGEKIHTEHSGSISVEDKLNEVRKRLLEASKRAKKDERGA